MSNHDWLISELEQIAEYASKNHIMNFVHLIQAANAQLVAQRKATVFSAFEEPGHLAVPPSENVIVFPTSRLRTSTIAGIQSVCLPEGLLT